MMESAPGAPDICVSVRLSGGESFEVTLSGRGERYLFGRAAPQLAAVVDVPLEDRHVSRRHCELFRFPGGNQWLVRDLFSSNGTKVNGVAIGDQPVPVAEGGRVQIGTTVLTVGFGHFPDARGPMSGGGAPGGAAAVAAGLAASGPGGMPHAGEAEDEDGTIAFDGATMVRLAGGADRTEMAPPAAGWGAPVRGGGEAPSGRDGAAMSYEATLIGGATAFESSVSVTSATSATAATATAGATVGDVSLMFDRTQISHDMGVPDAGRGAVTTGPTAYDAAGYGAAGDVLTQTHGPDRTTAARAGGAAAYVQQAAISERAELARAGLGGIVADIVEAQLLDVQKALGLARLARERGRTFFRELAQDASIRHMDDIYKLVAGRLGLELIADEKALMERAIDFKELPFTMASNLGAVLLSGASDEVVPCATIDPFDLGCTDWISHTFNKPVRVSLVMPNHFHAALQRLKNRREDDDGSTNVLLISLDPETERRVETRVDTVDVPQVVNYFLQKAHVEGASDIHIEPGEDYLLVRTRVDGMLHELSTLPAAKHPEIASRVKILSGMDVAEKRRPQDGRIATVIREHPIDVRVSTYPTIYGEKIVMRLLDKNALQATPATLGLIDRDLRRLYDKLEAPFGLVMISGPTGSGKTTSLYSCLNYIDKKTKNVMTVEDPVEYRLKGVHQMQVNEKIGLTFAGGLRTILRQDPDVIMVGECRDAETAGMAIQAALTGHIVFSTIHTNDAVGVITRLIDMGVDPFLVANALTMCVAQRLVRKICKHCQTSLDGAAVLDRLRDDGVSDERLEQLDIEIDADLSYVVGAGCVHCRNTGYQGRRAVFELFDVTHEARNMIVAPDFSADVLRKRAHEQGMTSLIGHGLMLVDEGITTHSEVLRVLGESY